MNGVAQHGQDGVPNQVDRGLVSGDQQQVAGGDDLLFGQLITGLLHRDQARQQIVAWL